MVKESNRPVDVKAEAQLPKKQKMLFTFALFGIPILFLFALEFGLRAAGYEGAPKLFIAAPKPYSHLLMINRNIGRRYFRSDRFIPTPSTDTFLKEKPPGGLRIFVLGGSTAAGFPYEENVRFSRFLENALQAADPQRPIEVVNLAMSAINSYAMLDMMDEVLAQKPDLILIYAGHNEYYGALGVASRESLGKSRAWVLTALKLRRLRLFMLMRNAVGGLRRVVEKPTTATLMERIVAEQTIPFNSDLYFDGIKQFEENLDAILQKAARQRVPVILSELVCNLRDQHPFISLPAESADEVFRQARQADAAGNYPQAKLLYLKAKELDALRFRAPEAINEVIRRAAQCYNSPLVPMIRRFEAASPNGLIGSLLMTDHLHPNIKGYKLMAQAFLDELINRHLITLSGDKKPLLDSFACAYTAADSLYGELAVMELKSGWPFVSESRKGAAVDQFRPGSRMEELVKQAVKYDNFTMRNVHAALAEEYVQRGDYRAALAEYRACTAFHPLTPVPYLKTAELCNLLQLFDLTPLVLLPFLRREASPAAEVLLAQAYLALRQYDRAEEYFLRAQKEMGDDQAIQLGLAAVRQAKEAAFKTNAKSPLGTAVITSKVVAVSPRVAALMQRAQGYLRSRSFHEAKRVLLQAVELENVPQAHMWLGQIYLDEGNFNAAVRHLQIARAGMPKHPYLLYNLTLAYWQNGDLERARESWKALQADFPTFQDPYRLGEQLGERSAAKR